MKPASIYGVTDSTGIWANEGREVHMRPKKDALGPDTKCESETLTKKD
jgi:hypothetical protein